MLSFLFLLGHFTTDSCLRFGPLIRCDVPAPRNPSAHSNPYVLFVLCFFLLFRCSATSAFFAARSPVVSARTRMHASFHFDSSAVVFPRHSISRRVRTKAQHPSAVVVTHSLSSAAPAMLKMPIMTCMPQFHLFLIFFPHLILAFFFFIRHGRMFEGSRLGIQVTYWLRVLLSVVVC